MIALTVVAVVSLLTGAPTSSPVTEPCPPYPPGLNQVMAFDGEHRLHAVDGYRMVDQTYYRQEGVKWSSMRGEKIPTPKNVPATATVGSRELAVTPRGDVLLVYSTIAWEEKKRTTSLFFQVRSPSGWQPATLVDSGGNDAGGSTDPDGISLTVDARGEPLVSYTSGKEFRVAERVAGAWKKDVVFRDDNLNDENAAALAPDGALHLLIGTDRALVYVVRKAGSSSRPRVLVPTMMYSPNIVVAADGDVHIATGGTDRVLTYFHGRGDAWSTPTPISTATTGFHFAMHLVGGAPRIVYADRTRLLVRVAYKRSDAWVSDTLPDAVMGQPIADIVVDPNGRREAAAFIGEGAGIDSKLLCFEASGAGR